MAIDKPNISQEQVKSNGRAAGILMHITSLPGSFGIGDLGPEAKYFVDSLHQSKQKYWQLLPLTPTENGTGHSPYSSISSMAGNTLLISPELLHTEGLLSEAEIEKHQITSTDKVDYLESGRIKNILFDKAFQNFNALTSHSLRSKFEEYCLLEDFWLHDFALYVALKMYHKGKPWYAWTNDFKLRDVNALKKFSNEFQSAITKTKWLQFIFNDQWRQLKTYCHHNDVTLVGDLPFYISYDSADVWSHPEIFALNTEGKMTGVAGVPPDYFNANGQLWGMPVFKWDKLKAQQYKWWVHRIKKNISLFDIIRLDHFRAFADYWEVPANEKTAIHGTWKPGPGEDLFVTLEKELGTLPFIAEDLGDINDAVYNLRDRFSFPGMKVLQFAFGENMPQSDYIPHNHSHNFFVYTGTHDNNTTTGWFRSDLSKADKKRLNQYVGRPVREKDVHLTLNRLAYASVAKTAILPMQDVLGLDENARMNTPASTDKNWMWRMMPGAFTKTVQIQLTQLCVLYDRTGTFQIVA